MCIRDRGFGVASGTFCAVLVGTTLGFAELTLALATLAFLVPTILISRAIELVLARTAAHAT